MKPQQSDFGSSRIMFIDDEEKVLQYVAAHLRPAGYEVITCRSWIDAEGQLGNSTVHPDLIFIEPLATDLGPGDGDLLERLCRCHRQRSVRPYLAASDHVDLDGNPLCRVKEGGP